YTHMLTTSFLAVAIFFGGWHLPGLAPGTNGIGDLVLKLAIFGTKVFLFVLFYMLIRWTLPRFRFDQLMGLAWKVLMPLALLNLGTVMVVKQFQLPEITLLGTSLALLLGAAAVNARLVQRRLAAPPRAVGMPLAASAGGT